MIVNDAMIGNTLEDIVAVSSLNSNYMGCPVMDFKPYAKYDPLSSGHINAGGLPIVLWEFLHATPAQVDALAAYCPGKTSSNVVIYTRTNENLDEYKYFSCIMQWDQEETITGLRRESLKIKFIDCVELVGS